MSKEHRFAPAAALAVTALTLSGCAAVNERFSCEPPDGHVPVEGKRFVPIDVYSSRTAGKGRGGARLDVRCIPWGDEPLVPVVVSVNSYGRSLCRQWFALPTDASRPGAKALATETPTVDERRLRLARAGLAPPPSRFFAPPNPACVVVPIDVEGGCDAAHRCSYRFKVQIHSRAPGLDRRVDVPPQHVTFDVRFVKPHRLPPGAKGGYRF